MKTTQKNTRPKAVSKKPANIKKKPVKNALIPARIFVLIGALVIAIFTLGATHTAGPLNAVFGPVSKTAPVAQKDITKMYTATGLASSSTVLVKFKSNASPAAIAAIHKQQSGKVTHTIPALGVNEVSVPDGGQVGTTLKTYRSHGEVEYAEPNPVAQRFFAPDDTLYAKQWNLAKINASQAWDLSQGGYGPIAVLDTGVEAAHADLRGESVAGFNFINDTTDTTDDNGHGTHVAGIIAGISNNTSGIASIGFKGSIMPIKVLDSTGAGTYSDLASGIVFAADHGAKILNLSLGGSSTSTTLENAIKYAQQKGAIVVAAAGNNGNSAAVYPAAYPGVVAVSATTPDDTLAAFSSYGSNVTVSAPGTGIISTYTNGSYATMSGTSMAAPEVAGLIGLALSKGQTTPATVLANLKQSSDKVGPYPYDTSGRNQYFGYGRINAAKLLQINAPAPTPTAAPAPVQSPAPSTPTSPEPKKQTVKAKDQNTHGQTNAQFSAELEGTVDAVDLTKGVISVKIKSISQNLKLADNNLIDLYVTGSTTMTSSGQTLPIASLLPGDKISGKALWQNNMLSAVSVKLQGRADPAPVDTTSTTNAAQGKLDSAKGRKQ